MNPITNASQPVVPLGVQAEETTNRLYIEWSNGHTTHYPIEWLALAVSVRGLSWEMGVPGRLDSSKNLLLKRLAWKTPSL